MTILTDFKALTFDQQAELFPLLSDAYNASKEARRRELRAELDALSDNPVKPKPTKAKYRSHKNPLLTWGGRGALASWLKAEIEESGKTIDAFLIKT